MELKIEVSESAWALLKAKKKDPKEFLRATVNKAIEEETQREESSGKTQVDRIFESRKAHQVDLNGTSAQIVATAREFRDNFSFKGGRSK